MNLRKPVILVLALCGFLPACSPGRDLVSSSPPPIAVSPAAKQVQEERNAPQDLIALLPEPDGRVGKIRVTSEGGSEVIDKAWFATKVESSGKAPLISRPMGENEIQDVFGAALAAQPDLSKRFVSFSLWFESDKIKLTPESKKALKEIVKTIKSRKAMEIFVAGHTDRVGTDSHNLKLSSKRASYVRDFLHANGINSGAFFVSYHGESLPLVYTEDEVAELLNRRVEVFVK